MDPPTPASFTMLWLPDSCYDFAPETPFPGPEDMVDISEAGVLLDHRISRSYWENFRTSRGPLAFLYTSYDWCHCCGMQHDLYDNAVTPGGGGGGRLERAEWSLIVPQWVGFMAPPMRMCGDTVMLFWSGKLYTCPVYTWWDSFETAPVTGSLLSVAANHRFAEMCDLFLRVVDSSARAIRGILCASESDRERPGAAWQTRSRLPS